MKIVKFALLDISKLLLRYLILTAKNHQLKLVAFWGSGFRLSAFGGCFRLPVETGSIKIGKIKPHKYLSQN